MNRLLILVVLAVTLGSLATAAQDISNVCVTVPGTAGGRLVGGVVSGTVYSYSASGCMKRNSNPVGAGGIFDSPDGVEYLDTNCSEVCGPEDCGVSGAPPYPGFFCPNQKKFSLVGQIGGAACFQLGSSGTFTAAATGNLQLYFNDDIYGDNSGSYNVCIAVGSGGVTNPPPTSSNSTACVLSPTNGGSTATRSARFWFTHPYPAESNCANLRDALIASGTTTNDSFQLPLGFITLPGGYFNNDYVTDVEDAVLGALGLYWRKNSRTGELGGTQGYGLAASRLCRARKSLAVEVLAALANVNLLGTSPTSMTYNAASGITNFPATLPCDAITALADENLTAILEYTALLRKFNASGQTNNFAGNMVECSSQDLHSLRLVSRDPTTQQNCPGPNEFCETATAIYFPALTDIFGTASFTDKADLRRYANDFPQQPTCGGGGADAVWKIKPSIAVAGRPFTVMAPLPARRRSSSSCRACGRAQRSPLSVQPTRSTKCRGAGKATPYGSSTRFRKLGTGKS